MKTEDKSIFATQHAEAPYKGTSNALADDMVTVHYKDALDNAKAAAQIFGKTNEDNVRELSKDALESIGKEIPPYQVSKSIILKSRNNRSTEHAPIFKSKGEVIE